MEMKTPTAVSAPARARELGAFLRARRESLDPDRLGLFHSGRRRTPGLRREEVAQLADIGITWYTKLEQGRAQRASPKVLEAIAAALQCSDSETDYLFTLAGLGRAERNAAPVCERISCDIQLLLDRIAPLPALLQNARFDVLAYNRAYCQLIGVDLDQIPTEDRNCIHLALTHPGWRAALADWDEALTRMVAMFRSAFAEHREESAWRRQLERYQQSSAEFRAAWLRNEVRGIENQTKRFRHAQQGILSLRQTNWWSAPRNGDRLLVYLPADEESRAKLAALSGGKL